MKLQIPQKALAAALSAVRPAIPTKTLYPVTGCCLLTAGEGELRVTATDLAISLTCTVPADVTEPGATAVPGRLLGAVVSGLPSGAVTVETRKTRVHIASGQSESDLNPMPADDFPPIPGGFEPLLTIDAAELRRALGQIVHSAAPDADTSRPVLNAICWTLGEEDLTFAAADGFRLAVTPVTLGVNLLADPRSVLVPASALRPLVGLLGEGTVEIGLNKSASSIRLGFAGEAGPVEMVAQLKQGAFPTYQQLIPKEWSTRVTFAEPGEFTRAVRFASLISGDDQGTTRIVVTPSEGSKLGTVRLFARSEQVGEQQCEVTAEVEGPGGKIAFRSAFLKDVLASFEALSASVVFEFQGPSTPGVFRTVDERGLEVVMPMFVQWWRPRLNPAPWCAQPRATDDRPDGTRSRSTVTFSRTTAGETTAIAVCSSTSRCPSWSPSRKRSSG